MFSDELKALLPQIITSWEVIAATVVLILFTKLVNYVARSYHRPRSVSKSKPKRAKKEKAPKPESNSDELNLGD